MCRHCIKKCRTVKGDFLENRAKFAKGAAAHDKGRRPADA